MEKQFYLHTGAVGTDLFEKIRVLESRILLIAEESETLENRILLMNLKAEMKAATDRFLSYTNPVRK